MIATLPGGAVETAASQKQGVVGGVSADAVFLNLIGSLLSAEAVPAAAGGSTGGSKGTARGPKRAEEEAPDLSNSQPEAAPGLAVAAVPTESFDRPLLKFGFDPSPAITNLNGKANETKAAVGCAVSGVASRASADRPVFRDAANLAFQLVLKMSSPVPVDQPVQPGTDAAPAEASAATPVPATPQVAAMPPGSFIEPVAPKSMDPAEGQKPIEAAKGMASETKPADPRRATSGADPAVVSEAHPNGHGVRADDLNNQEKGTDARKDGGENAPSRPAAPAVERFAAQIREVSNAAPESKPSAPKVVEPTDLPVARNIEPARHISLRLPDSTDGRVDLQLTERAGRVQIDVRASNPDVAHSLQTNIDELMQRLQNHGYVAQRLRA